MQSNGFVRRKLWPCFPQQTPTFFDHHCVMFYQAQQAVSERTGSVLDDPDQLVALAVAVASSDEPLSTLETLCQSVLDGVDVGTALKALLDRGKKRDSKGCVREGDAGG